MRPAGREVAAYGIGVVAGAVIFFLSFAAVFNGSWPLLALFVSGYVIVGGFGVGMAGVPPARMAAALTLPGVPWVLWLFPAAIAEAGVLRALLWPAILVAMFGLAWIGGILGAFGQRGRVR